MKSKTSYWRPLVLLFILLNVFFIAGKNWLAAQKTDYEVLIICNLVLMVATSLSFWISQRSLGSSNPQASVRAMYGSFMVKFSICVVAAFAYIMVAKKEVNKPALFIGTALYLIYTFIEVSTLTKMLKEKKNAQERTPS
jgi:F0F1-type ATP synthase assembly protein I